MDEALIKKFIAVNKEYLPDFGAGYGSGIGSGAGSGAVGGEGSGDSYGSSKGYGGGAGEGSGDGDGCGFGKGYGYDSGYGYGNGNGFGSGSGYGSGNGNGSGSGSGEGFGSGNGDGCGFGKGYGYGFGDGFGNGYGYGEGYGFGIKSINGHELCMIDYVPTIITKVRQNIAKGYIVNDNFTFSPCFIVKQDVFFAHGKTIKEAVSSVRNKVIANLNIEEKIDEFLKEFKLNQRYSGHKFFKWHNLLTGSCLVGREHFVKNNNLSLDDEYTVDEFVDICKNAYGFVVIKKLINKIKKRKSY